MSSPYQCLHCEKETENAHSITEYWEDGTEKGIQILCSPCYEEWLLSLKG